MTHENLAHDHPPVIVLVLGFWACAGVFFWEFSWKSVVEWGAFLLHGVSLVETGLIMFDWVAGRVV